MSCSFSQDVSQKELEFKRRVWWVFYIVSRGEYIYYLGLPLIENLDISVNLPQDDFKWRYGGSKKIIDEEIAACY
ncbi:hypothetical protein AYI68_g6953 [Smittium mucronatum]|uniref:Transcription factor domain-containing protein n=1 Tax=Smittium mucronatum TaxID=133383 RepID=A0A1R0GQ21_9FUNG|nr:hypothetical protein AYI68_g6953 [Smittium mucronatum]